MVVLEIKQYLICQVLVPKNISHLRSFYVYFFTHTAIFKCDNSDVYVFQNFLGYFCARPFKGHRTKAIIGSMRIVNSVPSRASGFKSFGFALHH